MVNPSRVFGPNFRKLVIHKMSLDAIPAGGGVADGIKFLTNPSGMKQGWLKAQEWCEAAVLAIKQAASPNPWRNSTEEEICAEILRRLKA